VADLRRSVISSGTTALKRTGLLRVALTAAVCMVLVPQVHANPLTERKLELMSVAPGASTTHTFTFSYGSASDVGSIRFEYCTSPLPDITCDTPVGLDVSGAALSNQTGETGFAIDSAQTNSLVLTRTAAPPTQNPSSYTFDTVTNPSTPATTFFVRISTYQTTDATGGITDYGAVANATTDNILLNTEVPPILKFCVGLTLGTDCNTADDNLIDLGDLSTTRAASGSSQMLAATNAEFGLAIAAYGTTMTSGNNVITALTNPTLSAPGNAQFGINLRQNSDPSVGGEPSGAGTSLPASSYNIANRYMFQSGDVVATSPVATDTRIFTASYIVNTSPSQPPGVYTATITYICTATF